LKKNLTHATVAALKAPATGQVDYWDTRKPGFGIRVSPAGTKTWFVMYRAHGRKKRLKLGRFSLNSEFHVSVADARAKAASKLGAVAQGADPAEERARAKTEPTFGELAELYLERHARAKKRQGSVYQDERMLRADLLPAWGGRKASTISRRDVIALVDEIVARGAPVHANRVLALTSTIFNFAIGRDLLEVNPAYRIARPTLERSRDRRLSDEEIRRLWMALEGEPLKVQAAFKLALLTCARRSELLGMAWTELDLDRGWWTLPADRTKRGEEHRIPLAPTAVSLLRHFEAASKSPIVLSGGRTGRAMTTPQKWMTKIRASAGLEDFVFHDLRRTAASGLSSIGVPRLTISKILNHAEGGVTKVYDRHSYDPEKRAALAKWERHLIEIVTGKPASNVIALQA
jgi:integrase